jgi:PAS domain S-box-containing protein
MFRLLRYFSITSAVVFIIVMILLGVFYRQLLLNDLFEIAENKNVALTQSFSNSLWPQFAPFVNAASTLQGDALRRHPEIAKLRQLVLAQMKGLSVVKVKVYNMEGLTVFSTDPVQIGEDKSTNPGFLAARTGGVVSELTHRDAFSAFEGTISDRDLFSSYIPIRRDPTAPIEGVFEVYDDITPLIEQINRSQRSVVLGGALILVSLYIILFFIVRRADHIIQQQYAEIKQTDEAFRRSEEQFRRVVASISDHIYVTQITAEGQQINRYLSPHIESLTGYPLENFMVDWSFWPSTVIHPDDRAAAKAQAERLARGQSGEMEYRLVKADGQLIWVRDSGRVEKDVIGNGLIIYGVVSDITERKQAQQSLSLAHEQALQASRLKSQLVANVSHDLRTPLNAILGYTEMLQEGVYGPLLDNQQDVTRKVINTTLSLTELVNQLLHQAQLEAGTLKLNNTSFTPAELIERIPSTVDLLLQARGLRLACHIEANVPSTLSGDLNGLRQILANLIGNAVKFTEEGSINLRIFCPDEDHWALQVSDTGPGIPDEAQAHVFDAFWQLDGTATRRHSGFGLGLSIVKQLTTLMGGEVILESKVGQGTTFTVLLPLHEIEETVL